MKIDAARVQAPAGQMDCAIITSSDEIGNQQTSKMRTRCQWCASDVPVIHSMLRLWSGSSQPGRCSCSARAFALLMKRMERMSHVKIPEILALC